MLEITPHLYARTRINDTVEHIPRRFFSAAAVARRSLSYVSGRPSFYAPSTLARSTFCSISFLLFSLFLSAVASHSENPNAHTGHRVHGLTLWLFLSFLSPFRHLAYLIFSVFLTVYSYTRKHSLASGDTQTNPLINPYSFARNAKEPDKTRQSQTE